MQTSHNFETDQTDAWNEVFDPEGILEETCTGLFDVEYSRARYSDERDECGATLVALRIKRNDRVTIYSRDQAWNIFGPKQLHRIEDAAADAYMARRDESGAAYDRARVRHLTEVLSLPDA